MTRFDLHVHTALSACAEDLMSPRQVLAGAARAGLTMIAVTDHNATRHVQVARRLQDEFALTVVPGMEVMTREEVHLLALFEDMQALAAMQALVDRSLPDASNDESMVGCQLIYDEFDEIVGVDERLRQAAVSVGLDRLVDVIHASGGVAIPAHAHRPKFSIVSQLGFIDPEAGFDALEVTRRRWTRRGYRLGDREAGFPLIASSDAHFLEDIGRSRLEWPVTCGTVCELIGAL